MKTSVKYLKMLVNLLIEAAGLMLLVWVVPKMLMFFLPLVMAGAHLSFAFPLVQKLLMLFNLMNVPLLVLTTLVSYLVFALFYFAVYRMTANAYFKIVSTGIRQARG